jgi:hypothetical protein
MEERFVMVMELVLMELVSVTIQKRFNLIVRYRRHHHQNAKTLLMVQPIVILV